MQSANVVLSVILLLILAAPALAADYYFDQSCQFDGTNCACAGGDPEGNPDACCAANSSSPGACRTKAKFDGFDYGPGDTVNFRGGTTFYLSEDDPFTKGLRIQNADTGEEGNPWIFQTYPSTGPKATISGFLATGTCSSNTWQDCTYDWECPGAQACNQDWSWSPSSAEYCYGGDNPGTPCPVGDECTGAGATCLGDLWYINVGSIEIPCNGSSPASPRPYCSAMPSDAGISGNGGWNFAWSEAFCEGTGTCSTSGGYCSKHADCPAGESCTGAQTCDEDVDCAKGTCSISSAQKCALDLDCPAGETCERPDLGRCYSQTATQCSFCQGGTTPGQPCQNSGECGGTGICIDDQSLCGDAELCVRSKCSTPELARVCINDGECAAGDVCGSIQSSNWPTSNERCATAVGRGGRCIEGTAGNASAYGVPCTHKIFCTSVESGSDCQYDPGSIPDATIPNVPVEYGEVTWGDYDGIYGDESKGTIYLRWDQAAWGPPPMIKVGDTSTCVRFTPGHVSNWITFDRVNFEGCYSNAGINFDVASHGTMCEMPRTGYTFTNSRIRHMGGVGFLSRTAVASSRTVRDRVGDANAVIRKSRFAHNGSDAVTFQGGPAGSGCGGPADTRYPSGWPGPYWGTGMTFEDNISNDNDGDGIQIYFWDGRLNGNCSVTGNLCWADSHCCRANAGSCSGIGVETCVGADTEQRDSIQRNFFGWNGTPIFSGLGNVGGGSGINFDGEHTPCLGVRGMEVAFNYTIENGVNGILLEYCTSNDLIHHNWAIRNGLMIKGTRGIRVNYGSFDNLIYYNLVEDQVQYQGKSVYAFGGGQANQSASPAQCMPDACDGRPGKCQGDTSIECYVDQDCAIDGNGTCTDRGTGTTEGAWPRDNAFIHNTAIKRTRYGLDLGTPEHYWNWAFFEQVYIDGLRILNNLGYEETTVANGCGYNPKNDPVYIVKYPIDTISTDPGTTTDGGSWAFNAWKARECWRHENTVYTGIESIRDSAPFQEIGTGMYDEIIFNNISAHDFTPSLCDPSGAEGLQTCVGSGGAGGTTFLKPKIQDDQLPPSLRGNNYHTLIYSQGDILGRPIPAGNVSPGAFESQSSEFRYVSTNGDDQLGTNDCTNEQQPCLTPQHCVNQIQDGETCLMEAGTYTQWGTQDSNACALSPSTSLVNLDENCDSLGCTLRAEVIADPPNVILEQAGSFAGITVEGNGWTVQGIQVDTNVPFAACGLTDMEVKNNVFIFDHDGRGMIIQGVSDALISNNDIISDLDYPAGCTLVTSSVGILAFTTAASDHITFEDNFFARGGRIARFIGAHHNITFKRNIFEQFYSHGIETRSESSGVGPRAVLFENNIFRYGLGCTRANSNTQADGARNFDIYEATQFVARNNTIDGRDWAYRDGMYTYSGEANCQAGGGSDNECNREDWIYTNNLVYAISNQSGNNEYINMNKSEFTTESNLLMDGNFYGGSVRRCDNQIPTGDEGCWKCDGDYSTFSSWSGSSCWGGTANLDPDGTFGVPTFVDYDNQDYTPQDASSPQVDAGVDGINATFSCTDIDDCPGNGDILCSGGFCQIDLCADEDINRKVREGPCDVGAVDFGDSETVPIADHTLEGATLNDGGAIH